MGGLAKVSMVRTLGTAVVWACLLCALCGCPSPDQSATGSPSYRQGYKAGYDWGRLARAMQEKAEKAGAKAGSPTSTTSDLSISDLDSPGAVDKLIADEVSKVKTPEEKARVKDYWQGYAAGFKKGSR